LVWLGEEGDAGEAITFLVEIDNIMWGSGELSNMALDRPGAIGVRRFRSQQGEEEKTKWTKSFNMPENLR
jgi:hypothetical protein